MSYESFIARRYFKSKRETGFISLITYISIVGVTIGVAALIIVLSIMNGFESEVRSRFIGFDAHVRLQGFHNQGLKNYEEILKEVQNEEHVIAAVPFILDKAMVKIGDSVEGIVIKGTDPERAVQVTDLAANMIYGDLDFST
ncbi:MAG: ABC transporter permease [bacterium]